MQNIGHFWGSISMHSVHFQALVFCCSCILNGNVVTDKFTFASPHDTCSVPHGFVQSRWPKIESWELQVWKKTVWDGGSREGGWEGERKDGKGGRKEGWEGRDGRQEIMKERKGRNGNGRKRIVGEGRERKGKEGLISRQVYKQWSNHKTYLRLYFLHKTLLMSQVLKR